MIHMVKDRFEIGRSFEDANYLALKKGLQIVICEKKRKSNDYIFMTPKASRKGSFKESLEGKEVVNKHGHEIDRKKTNLVSRIDDYLPIPGKNRNFWKEIKEKKIFYMWDIEEGPMKFFEDANNMLFWVLRVYETPFYLSKNDDYEHGPRGNNNIIDPKIHEKLKNLYDKDELEPVIESDEEFYERKEKIKEIIDRHT